jgi:PGM1 C-terminal domain
MNPSARSTAEVVQFAELQGRLAPLFRAVFDDPAAPRTVVVVPGLSLDQELLSRIDGLQHYEERQLTMLMLLRLPNTRLVFVTSTPIDPIIIDYYLNLLPGVPHAHARRRLTLLSAYDASPVTLTRKVLERPRLLARIRAAIGDPQLAHLSCFNVTPLERALALALAIPLYGCDPELAELGSKSGSRDVFRAARVPMPAGFGNLRDATDIAQALAAMRAQDPALEHAVVKLNDGASGEGNALFSYAGAPRGAAALARWVEAELSQRLVFELSGETWLHYQGKLAGMGGIVEAWVAGEGKRSPSVQLRITPTARLEVISTHDQVLGGSTGQKFLGATFPADPAYRQEIAQLATRVGAVLLGRGVIGRFSVDFVSVPGAGGAWRHSAIEINLRKGGTTHTFQTLQYLTNGNVDPATGEFSVPTGQRRVYYATDNLQNAAFRRLTPDDLIDVAVEQGLHFDQTRLEGVTFNLIGALSEFGKLGVVAIAGTPLRARELFDRTAAVLGRATG